MKPNLASLSTILTLSAVLCSTQASAADEYLEVSMQACNHLKSCAKQNMQDIPPEYRQMVEQSLATMCQALPSAESIPGFSPNHKLYQPAVACMKSITAQSCKQLETSEGSTPECDKLSKMQ